jgi:hypothetical protein
MSLTELTEGDYVEEQLPPRWPVGKAVCPLVPHES